MEGDRGEVMGGKVRGAEGAEGPQQRPGPKGPPKPTAGARKRGAIGPLNFLLV